MQQLSGLTTQRGASVTNIVLIIMVLGISLKLMVAILPAQIGDYQLTKLLSAELKVANNNNETAKQVVDVINQISIP